MSEIPPPEPTPQAPPPASSPYYAAPASAAAGAKPPILSIVALVASGLGFLGGMIVIVPIVGSILDLFLPTAGVVLGFVARVKEPQAPRWMWIVAVSVGFFCILWALGWLVGYIVTFAADPYST